MALRAGGLGETAGHRKSPPVYANPPPTVYVVPVPVYTAPWVAAPPHHLYDYQYGYPPPTKWEQKGFCPPGQAKKGNC